MAMQKGMTARNASNQIVGSKGLTDKQRAFVNAMMRNGGNQTAAAKAAGYADPASSGWHLCQIPAIQTALHQLRQRHISNLATAGLDLLRQVIRGETEASMPVRVDASKFIINLAGHTVPKEDTNHKKDAKSLATMTVSEMEAIVRQGEDRLARMKLVDAKVIDVPVIVPVETQDIDNAQESTASPRQGPTIDGEVTRPDEGSGDARPDAVPG